MQRGVVWGNRGLFLLKFILIKTKCKMMMGWTNNKSNLCIAKLY